MKAKYCTIKDIVEILNVDEGFIVTMEQEEIISFCYDKKKGEKLLPEKEVEKLRIAKTLMDDMDINLHGVEVILRMRENMFEMRRQFDEILKDLAGEVRRIVKSQSG